MSRNNIGNFLKSKEIIWNKKQAIRGVKLTKIGMNMKAMMIEILNNLC